MRNESDESFPRLAEPGVEGFKRLVDNRAHQNDVLLSESTAGDKRRRRRNNQETALGWWDYSVHEQKLPSTLKGGGGFDKSRSRCPLIYSADVKTAHKHGLYLSEVRLCLQLRMHLRSTPVLSKPSCRREPCGSICMPTHKALKLDYVCVRWESAIVLVQ